MNSGSTVRVAARVQHVDADEDVARLQYLGPAEREREHHRVARRNVGDRDSRRGRLGHRDRAVGERRAADSGQVHLHDAVLTHPQRGGDAARGLKLGHVALAIVDRQRVAGEALRRGDRERGGGIEAAGEQYHGARVAHFPGTLPHRYLWSWIWKRTGKRSARIQSASSRAASSS